MCYSIPGKIIDLKDKLAFIDYFGETRKARNDFFDLSVGEYVYAQGGFVIQKVSAREAAESLEAWEELFFQLKKTDERLSVSKEGIKTGAITAAEALRLLSVEKKEEKELLFSRANALRQKLLSNSCCVHGIIEFSNYCSCNCLYCGINKSNTALNRYRMTKEEILGSVEEAAGYGFKSLVLQSGEDDYYTAEVFEEIVKTIMKKYPALIFLSVGERKRAIYERLFDAGARGVLLRFETSDKNLYERMRPGKRLDDRLELIRFLSKLGFIVATGGLLGLPSQTKESLVDDILLAKSMNAEMYSFGPFIPHPDTPLKNSKIIDEDEVLKFIAVNRLLVPDAKILVTTALETIGKDTRRLGLLSGANSFMLNLTPLKYRRQYEIYQNRAGVDKTVKEQIAEALALLKEIGRAPTDLGL